MAPTGVWYPPPPMGDPALDAELVGNGVINDVTCPLCAWRGPLGGFNANLRESGHCPSCGAWTRIRQLAVVLLEVGEQLAGRPLRRLGELADVPGVAVYNTEAQGPVHEALHAGAGYRCSEYFGADLVSGQLGPGGVVHQDLEALSYADASFDLVVSTDVFEHVAEPYVAHREVHRVLRPGGHHVFTVPFHEDRPLDEIRARRQADGTVEHLAEPLLHGDPIRADGVLVYRIFGLEMVVELGRIGFDPTVRRLYDPSRGLVGGAGVVFCATKRSSPSS